MSKKNSGPVSCDHSQWRELEVRVRELDEEGQEFARFWEEAEAEEVYLQGVLKQVVALLESYGADNPSAEGTPYANAWRIAREALGL